MVVNGKRQKTEESKEAHETAKIQIDQEDDGNSSQQNSSMNNAEEVEDDIEDDVAPRRED
jgi:hypothetical protein